VRDTTVGIVGNDDVARVQRLAMLRQHVLHGVDKHAHLIWGAALTDETTVAVADSSSEIANFAHTRTTSTVDGQRHFLGNRCNLVSDHFDENRIKRSLHNTSMQNVIASSPKCSPLSA